jgi:hypothetical protein
MCTNKNSFLLVCITISISKFILHKLSFRLILILLVLLWCTVQPTYADTNEEEEHHLVENKDEDNSGDDRIDDFLDLYRRASLRPVVLHQRASLRPFAGKRASLRPFAGKRASLRPFAGKRASLRPFAGKRASLRPANYMGKRKRRDVMLFDE